MNDHPIIFSAPMVKSLLSGSKTMTRRLAWGKPALVRERDRAKLERRGYLFERRNGDCFASAPSLWQRVKLGDQLWVREGWRAHSIYDAVKPRLLPQSRVWYLADAGNQPKGKVRSSGRFMPRWASRLTLIVTATKIERLTDISERDCFAEGVTGEILDTDTGKVSPFGPVALMNFGALWEKLHGKGCWLDNPEVVALTFVVHKTNIDAIPSPTIPRHILTQAET